MGAGKSSVGRALGQRLNWPFEDLDDRIESREGRSIAEIFRDSGESAFRSAEHSALREVLDELRSGAARIVALGGGAFVQRRNAGLLKAFAAPVVFLDAPVEELWRRCHIQAGQIGANRPLLGSGERFRELYRARRGGYLRASLRIETGGRTVDAVAAEIAETLDLTRIPRRREPGDLK